jgi:hypothetical protein
LLSHLLHVLSVVRPVVGFCQFVVDASDLRELRTASDLCAAEAERIARRHRAHAERLLYDRMLILFDPVTGDEAAAAALELRAAVVTIGHCGLRSDVAVGLADADVPGLRWGTAHVAARVLASAARTGEVLVDRRLRSRLGPHTVCAAVDRRADGLRAWRLLSAS